MTTLVQRSYFQNVQSMTPTLTLLDFSFKVDSTQTAITANYKVSSLTGSGIYAIALVSTGVYQVTLNNNYNRFLGCNMTASGISDTHVAIASLSNGASYVITTMGTSVQADWVLAGMSPNVTAAVGVAFTAVTAASGSSGTGYASPQITSAANQIVTYGDPQTTIAASALNSAYFYIQTLAPTDSTHTTLIATTPSDGTFIKGRVFLRTAAQRGAGEPAQVPAGF